MNKAVTYYVDETGDGVLFGHKGRILLSEPNPQRFFMLGMIRCEDDTKANKSIKIFIHFSLKQQRQQNFSMQKMTILRFVLKYSNV
jgi:hypothetical protein